MRIKIVNCKAQIAGKASAPAHALTYIPVGHAAVDYFKLIYAVQT